MLADPLMTEMHRLLERDFEGDASPVLTRIEETLTEGSARALLLEAERHRIAQAIGDLTSRIARAGDDAPVDELSGLISRLQAADGDLNRLRSMLGSLRLMHREIRAAA